MGGVASHALLSSLNLILGTALCLLCFLLTTIVAAVKELR